jgi:hypothetical protein
MKEGRNQERFEKQEKADFWGSCRKIGDNIGRK